jgi:hypothetical protein
MGNRERKIGKQKSRNKLMAFGWFGLISILVSVSSQQDRRANRYFLHVSDRIMYCQGGTICYYTHLTFSGRFVEENIVDTTGVSIL